MPCEIVKAHDGHDFLRFLRFGLLTDLILCNHLPLRIKSKEFDPSVWRDKWKQYV